MNTAMPSFQQIKKTAEQTAKDAEELFLALEFYGQEPGEPWHAAADELRAVLSDLNGELAGIRGRLSLPAAGRQELDGRVGALSARLDAARNTLRAAMPAACPPPGGLTPPEPASESAWKKYDKLHAALPPGVPGRAELQRLARRAHDPAAALSLVHHLYKEPLQTGNSREILPALREVLFSTPLPRLGGLTVLAYISRSGRAATGLFDNFVEDVGSKDPVLRKAARAGLEHARQAANDEYCGYTPSGGFAACAKMWEVWTGVKTALSWPDPRRRRAALCALPHIRFCYVLGHFPWEFLQFIAAALRDTDATVRQKALRFATDFMMIERLERPELAEELEAIAKKLASEAGRKQPGIAASARKLLKAAEHFREFDRFRGIAPAAANEDGGREVVFNTPRRRPFTTVLQLEVTLIGTKPPVWRRIQVPASYTFYDLHVAIQNAMGWTDSHLHAFEIENSGMRPARLESPYAVEDQYEETEGYTTETPLASYLRKEGDEAIYEYDFGDGWRHAVRLEKILPREAGKEYPVCLDGSLACPPEDCGGNGGYADCVRLARGGRPLENESENRSLREWLGNWDPDNFDPAKVVFEDPRTRFIDTME